MKTKLSRMIAMTLAVLCLSACGASDDRTVAVQTVAEIVGSGAVGHVNRFAGIVVSGESSEVKRDAKKTVKELKVKVGDTVNKGDVLFTYDTDAMQLQLEKLKLELDELANKKSSAEYNLPVMKNKLLYATATDQLAINLQIQTLESDILESDYNMNLKRREIAAMEKDMNNVEVCSPISGRVMSIKDDDSGSDGSSFDVSGSDGSSDSSSSSGQAFITVTDVDTLRVKGNINEMNSGSLYVGIPVVIRSRMDEGVTYQGVLQKIDWETTVNTNSTDMYAISSNEMTSSSKYPFYVTLNSFEGLLMGQHVYIEPDYGQDAQEESIALPTYYIVSDGDESYVWAENSRGKIEKRRITIGESDTELGTTAVLSGLTEKDKIAFPEEGIKAGLKCVAYSETLFSDSETAGAAVSGGLG